MPQTLTTTQLAQYLNTIQNGGVEAARQVYGDLYNQGYNYAGWALGVANGTTITGQSALDYLSGTAMMGLGGDACRNLSDAQIDKIRKDMAEGYVGTMIKAAELNGGTLDRDVSYIQTKDFHKEAFEKNNLSLDNWTLNTPMELIRREKGDAAVEAIWQRVRETGGNGIDSLMVSTGLAQTVGRNAFSPDAVTRQQAQDWIDKVPGVANWQQIGRFIEVFGKAWSESFDEWGNAIAKSVSDAVNSAYRTATAPIRRDPLAIDLDADGIETVGVTTAPILFDHNADGIRTGTGWVAPDDAWLVLDRNGNGSIDTGRELFGVDTQITVTEVVNGVQTTVTRSAANGFEALRTLDANGDGVFNAQDAVFTQVQLWRDLNQDGISQGDELSTLAEHSIVSIGLMPDSMATTNLGNGNTVTGTATVTTGGGGTTQIDSVDLSAGNLNLADNPFYRDFTDTVPLSEAASALPDMGGSGVLRDLREAMSLGTAQAQALATAVHAFAHAPTRDQQVAQLDALLTAWAATANPMASSARNLPGQVERFTIASSTGVDFAAFGARFGTALDQRGLAWRDVSGSTGERAQALGGMLQQAGLVRGWGIQQAGNSYGFDYWTLSALDVFAQSHSESALRVATVEQFNGMAALNEFTARVSSGSVLDSYRVTVPQNNIDGFNLAYEALRQSVYESLVVQTRLQPYLDSIGLLLNETGIRFDTAALATRVDAGRSDGNREVLIDLIELNRYAQGTLRALEFDGLGRLRSWIGSLPSDSSLHATLAQLNVRTHASGDGSDASDILFGSAAADSISAGRGNDILVGDAGADLLLGENGDDRLDGGTDNDLLSGGSGADLLEGGTGNDSLYGDSGNDVLIGGDGNDFLYDISGADVLTGGAGNDELSGGDGQTDFEGGTGSDSLIDLSEASADTYRYNLGDGADTLSDRGGTDTVRLGAGIAPAATSVRSDSAGYLVLTFADGGTLTLNNQAEGLTGTAHLGHLIEQIVFADGTVWDAARLRDLAMVAGGDAADVIYGFDTDDALIGAAGNDILGGRGGNDAMDGGTGNDILTGGAGADMLAGGAGNDLLIGDADNDTVEGGVGDDKLWGGAGDNVYLFGRGDGQDMLQEHDGLFGAANGLVRFKAGVMPTDVIVRRVLNESFTAFEYLELSIAGTDDKILVKGFLPGDDPGTYKNPLQEVQFADGTTWDLAAILAKMLPGTAAADALIGTVINDTINGAAGDDTLWGRAGDDVLNGGADADTLRGEAGADTLSGGTGRDFLEGGEGDDTYFYERGGSQDVIRDSAGSDTLRFAAGIGPADLTLLRVSGPPVDFKSRTTVSFESDSLVITGPGGDQIWVSGFFGASAIENIAFADGSVWSSADIIAKIANAPAAINAMSGTSANDVYTVDHVQDTVVEAATAGIDRVDSQVSHTLAVNVENLSLTGVANAMAVGNALNNEIRGNVADNVLDGKTGVDTLVGGQGDDVYVVTSDQSSWYEPRFGYRVQASVFDRAALPWDTVVELVGEGIDTLVTSQYRVRLPDNVENLVVGGMAIYDLEQDYMRNWNNQLKGISYSVAHLVYDGKTSDTRPWFVGNQLDNRIDVTDGSPGTTFTGYQTFFAGVLIDGGAGADTMIGGTEATYYVVDNANDVVIETGTGNQDTIVSSALSVTLAQNIENIELLGALAINATGDNGSNDLRGSKNTASNILTGLGGDDTYYVGFGDVVVETANGGTDRVVIDAAAGGNAARISTGTVFRLSDYANVENIAANGYVNWNSSTSSPPPTEGIRIVGNEGDNEVFGSFQNDVVEGGAGNDYLRDQYMDLYPTFPNLIIDTDELYGGSGNDVLVSHVGNDLLDGGSGDDVLVAAAASRFVFGTGYGHDSMEYAAGSTVKLTADTDLNQITFVRRADDLVIGLSNGGVDELTLTGYYRFSSPKSVAIELAAGLVLSSSTVDTAAALGTLGGAATAADDFIVVPQAGGIVFADTGNDYVLGGAGNDQLNGEAGADTLSGGAGADLLAGGLDDDVLLGGSGADVIDGGLGGDNLQGGEGDDTYLVDSYGDQTSEGVDGGVDTVITALSWALAGSIENLELVGGAAVSGSGNGLNNRITGNSLDNSLEGGAGADTLIGGAGNDAYVVDDALDTVIELVGEGSDMVSASVSHTLAANVEILTLTGTSNIDAVGNALGNTLNGNGGANRLDGGTGADAMVGGGGNDIYVVDDAADTVTEAAGAGTDKVESSVTWTLGSNVENLALTGSGAVNGTGNTLANLLQGNNAANTLNGGTGADSMAGGAGDDIYVVDNTADAVTEAAAEGIDTVEAGVTWTLAANVENLTLAGSSAINATGNAIDNVLTGNSANNTLTGGAGNDFLDGGAGSDTMVGGTGNDTYVIGVTTDVVTEAANEGIDLVHSAVTLTLGANVENLTLTGTAAINGTGNTLNNVLVGNSANNTLDGGTGADTLAGGAGNDAYFVDNTADLVTENANEGMDLVQSSVAYTLAANVENLTLTGTSANNGTGNALDNSLTGNGANNTLTGGAGNDALNGGAGTDTLVGGAGNDTYVIDVATDVVTELANEGVDLVQSGVTTTLSANVENLTLTGTNAVNGTGNALDNTLTGNSANNTLTGGAGNDVIDGGAGNDTMLGGAGNDTYVTDATTDVVTEAANEGIDLVHSAVTLTLGANVENLTLTGTATINGTGNTLNNVLVGNSANNTLDGGTGADTLAGGAGNDTYVVDNTADLVTENANEGTDLVQSSVAYTLAANVENLTLTGASAINGTGNTLDNSLTGNSANNTLAGGAGNDTLNGGAGTDTLVGGAGNDTYVIDVATDVVTELANEGVDLVQSGVTTTLSANVENLTLTGATAVNGTGNALDNILTGNSANNTLTGGAGNDVIDGGVGNDTMVGGAGNDTYVINVATDVVTEAANEGIDLVQSAVTLTLGANVENLLLTGTTAINGTGNTLDNRLTGNSGNNTLTGAVGNDTLDGGLGNDTMVGGAGNDTYIVDLATDVVTELANEGSDTVQASVTLTLGNNVENLTLTGATAINGTGNALDNVLNGNSANNTLTGAAGNDTYRGGTGADTLSDTSTTSNEVYQWGRGEGADTLTDAGGTDRLDVLAGVAAEQIWLRHVGNNLELSVIGTSDAFTINGWYTSAASQVESFRLADGKTLTASRVAQLVDAMAAFVPPAAGQTTLPPNYQSSLQPTIAANWV